MPARRAAYWTTTTLIALSFLSGGVAYLFRADATLRGMMELGYPPYFLTILGVWKLLGGVVILAPRYPRLKEWAYAGVVFDLSGAAFSHLAMRQPLWHVVVTVSLLGMTLVSWALRPEGRKIGDLVGRVEPAVSGLPLVGVR
ncbi:MAG: DoxX family protein [Gemmatimonadota bacterium]